MKKNIAPGLCQWVADVRAGYSRDFKNKGKTPSESRNLDFKHSKIWNLIFNQRVEGPEFAFNARFSQLEAFKKKHKHCKVGATKDVIKLNRWVNNIRLVYRQTQQGEPTSRTLKEEWIKRLDEWDLFGIPKRARLSLN